jgi:hypothetical protein
MPAKPRTMRILECMGCVRLMKKSLGVALGLIYLCPLASAAPQPPQAYSIDQTRYFATPEIHLAAPPVTPEPARTMARTWYATEITLPQTVARFGRPRVSTS